MAIAEHVKRQAMDAVSHRETTAAIRQFTKHYSPQPQQTFFNSEKVQPLRSPIPDHVKKQAMDAVAKIRVPEKEVVSNTAKNQPSQSGPPTGEKSDAALPATKPKPDRQAAMDVGNHRETKAYVRLVSHNGPVSPLATPGRSPGSADRIAQMQRSGHNAAAIHAAATKGNFGMNYGR